MNRARAVGAARLGRRGERIAGRWLRRRGYRVLHRNLRIGHDEADLVVLDPDGVTIIVVEVKTRRSASPPPEDSVGAAKQRQMSRLASRLLRRRAYAERPVRFDVVALVWPAGARRPSVRHITDAFDARD